MVSVTVPKYLARPDCAQNDLCEKRLVGFRLEKLLDGLALFDLFVQIIIYF
jgi:hypothetical protein